MSSGIALQFKDKFKNVDCLVQWFSTGVTCHPGVTWTQCRGDTKSSGKRKENEVLSCLYKLEEELLLFFMEEESEEFTCFLEDHD
jgi:hypothetical protein